MESKYWRSAAQHRLTRRMALRGSMLGGAGLAALGLFGCGGSDSNTSSSSKPSGSTSLVDKPVDSTKRATSGGILPSVTNADTAGFNAYPHSALTVSSANDLAYSKFFKPTLANRANGDLPLTTVDGDILESFEIAPDGLTITGKLRKNAAFDPRPPTNSRAVTADDILYSWKKIKDQGKTRGILAHDASPSASIESVTASDASTIVFKLAFPTPSLLPNLAFGLNGAFIYPVEAEDKYDPRADMRGSGMWMLQTYQPSVSFQYRKNPNYYRKDRPYLDGVDYPIIAEYASQLAQFRAGRIHSITVKPEDQVQVKKEFPGVQMLAQQFATAVRYPLFFSFLPNSPWLDDRLRLALAMTIDRDLLTATIYNTDGFTKQGIDVDIRWNSHVGVGESEFWLDPKGKDFGDTAKYFKLDLAESAKLVKAATGKDKFASSITFPNPPQYGTEYQSTVPILKNMAEEGPFTLTSNGVDYTTVWATRVSGHSRLTGGHDFEGAAVAAVTDFPEVDSWFANHLIPGGPFYKFEENYPPANDKFYQLLDAQQKEQDRKKRVEIIKDFQRYAAGKMYIVPTIGAATTFQLGWGWVGNFGAFDGRGATGLQEWWLDKSKAPS